MAAAAAEKAVAAAAAAAFKLYKLDKFSALNGTVKQFGLRNLRLFSILLRMLNDY